MKIQSNSIILAPANMHLAIYQQILKEKNNCMNIQALSLSTYIHSFVKAPVESNLTILYKYREALKNLSSTNAYKDSIHDIQFLSSCLSFIHWMKLYNQTIDDLKETNTKEKDIKEIISFIYDIPVFEDHTQTILQELPDCQNIYIVNQQFNKLDSFWITQLLAHGAHLVSEHYTPEIFYYSVANNKKQAQLVSNLILQDNLNADDIFVACNNESEKQVLAQMFDLYHIPYTFVSQKMTSSLYQEWVHCLNWIQRKDLPSFLTMVESIFKQDFDDIYAYYSNFPEQFEKPSLYLNKLSYCSNNLIDENEFEKLQKLELKIEQWRQEHAYLFTWKLTDFEAMTPIIQASHKEITPEDLSTFQTINQFCIDATPFIQEAFDLSILIQQIEMNSSSSKASEIKGVLIGDKNEITSIRSILFLIGAHAKNYPSYTLESGLFDEVYIRSTNLPSLQERLEIQKRQMKDTLLDHTKLYVIYPQSNYEGSSFTRSNELDTWIQKTKNEDCQFIPIKDNSIFKKEEFTISKETSQELFFKNNVLSVSRLETFSKCPLQHFLKYGLRLKEPTEISDVQTRGTILHAILERSTKTYQKDYTSLTHEQIQAFVEEEFAFYTTIYPAKKDWIQVQIKDYTNTIERLLIQLKYFEDNWHMNFHDSEHKFKKEMKWHDLTIELIGYVDRIDTSSTSFCIFDYKSTKKELEVKKFQSGLSLQLLTYTLAYQEETDLKPVGCFYITLKAPYTDSKAIKVKYTKSQDNATLLDTDNMEEFIKQNLINGWNFDGIDNYQEDSVQIKTKKDELSIKEIKEQWPIIIDGILKDMAKEQVLPEHTSDACTYCKYERICRNERKEITKESYIEKEEAK